LVFLAGVPSHTIQSSLQIVRSAGFCSKLPGFSPPTDIRPRRCTHCPHFPLSPPLYPDGAVVGLQQFFSPSTSSPPRCRRPRMALRIPEFIFFGFLLFLPCYLFFFPLNISKDNCTYELCDLFVGDLFVFCFGVFPFIASFSLSGHPDATRLLRVKVG